MTRFENVPAENLAAMELEYREMLNTLEHQLCFIISKLLAVEEEISTRKPL